MIVGIIAAEEEEMLEIKKLMDDIDEQKIYNLNFVCGKVNGKNCVLVKCGVGKVNAARTTQLLIDKFEVNCVINVGSAGAVNPELQIEDIVIANELIQYDFYITQIGNYEKGEICEIGKYFKSDKKLIELCEQTIDEMSNENINIKIGRVGTADLFCADPQKDAEIREEFEVECVEMEGAAIAQVCMLDNIPFLVIRGISDTPNGNNKIDFHTYLVHASKRAGEILYRLVSKL